ncbi:hypothetical protein ASG92_23175 [Arthrobacter sp. Soil736]|uniref:hypothetical protein n=1 Tax=Arthrobacter sp. Soil736 TaxID=1736395 RepID=UPI0006F6A714|nr:hypothetical protein [Arthrobacter sp. Soil736]KRE58560.1 hypothetical protein ASG92_23175 [Arthrobacter sp. Soil736]
MARIPRLTPTGRQAVLVVHIAGGVGWMGLDADLLILAATGLTTDAGRTAASCYTAIGLVVPPAVLTLSLMLASGLILGLVTKWGLLRYCWVLVKLALGLVLTGLSQPRTRRHGDHGQVGNASVTLSDLSPGIGASRPMNRVAAGRHGG